MNSVALLGRLTKDPDVRYTTGDNPMAVCRVTLAVDRIGKDKGADFIRCVAFGKTAEVIGQYMNKGRQMAIVGHIHTDSFTNKEGQKVYTTDVIIDRMDFVGSKSDAQPPEKQEQMAIPEGYEAIDESEVPF